MNPPTLDELERALADCHRENRRLKQQIENMERSIMAAENLKKCLAREKEELAEHLNPKARYE